MGGRLEGEWGGQLCPAWGFWAPTFFEWARFLDGPPNGPQNVKKNNVKSWRLKIEE